MADEMILSLDRVTRRFDISKPLLNRMIEGVGKQYLTATADVSLSIARGETFALVGESGSGKSTIAKMIMGLMPPSVGEIRFDGDLIDPRHGIARATRRRFQMIFQDPFASLNPRWRVGDIIAEPIRTFALMPKTEVAGEVARLLEVVGLAPRDAEKYPHEFSGGQRQRIAIARALSSKPEFIVCDEPTSALDVSVQAQILNLMRDLQDAYGLTYLLISHDLSVVRHMADRIGVLYLGRLVEVAPSADLFAAPQHPYTRMLLDAVPDLTRVGARARAVVGEIPNPISPPSGCAFHPRCPLAQDICKTTAPEARSLGDRGRSVACHMVDGAA
ncbi:ATP-binding cassette domain-containing protein [Rhodobacteraceae bacterium XHP0102]|nr:ATP-binding cassette domain-containing protein [Rhodobacteraceae bacterium XHP0102]